MVNTVRLMRWAISWILWVDIWVYRHAQMIKAMEGMKDIQACYESAVMHIPILVDIAAVGISGLAIG